MYIFAVSELTRTIKEWLESNEVFQDVWVSGEVSNVTRAPSGHLYFTLKDPVAQLSCVMWRSQAARLAAPLSDGIQVVAHGYLSVYEQRGAYQLYTDYVQQAGVGDLYLQLEELKGRLAAEGLFDYARKRPLPRYPQRIGLVTSPRGAVVHDILTIMRRRYPLAHVIIAPTIVQGPEAPPLIVESLQAVAAVGVDVIIVARGGGSLEELWAFNDERVARGIAAAPVPVVSAIGHEVNVTIADLVADVRAPTPSVAAEMVAPDIVDVRAQIMELDRRGGRALRLAVQVMRTRLEAEQRSLGQASPKAAIARHRQRVDDLTHQLAAVIQHGVALRREWLEGVMRHLQALSPQATLDRGYAIVRRGRWGPVVTTPAQVHVGDPLRIHVSGGAFAARVVAQRSESHEPIPAEQLSLDLA